jgi:hypothetical protein
MYRIKSCELKKRAKRLKVVAIPTNPDEYYLQILKAIPRCLDEKVGWKQQSLPMLKINERHLSFNSNYKQTLLYMRKTARSLRMHLEIYIEF